MSAQQSPRLFGLLIYREHQDGASIEELSAALQLPSRWIEERIEAVRLCMEKQVRVELTPVPRPKRKTRARNASVNIRSTNKRRSL